MMINRLAATEVARSSRMVAALDRSNFDAARAAFGDDRTLRFLGMLADELEDRADGLRAAAEADDRSAIRAHAHAVASAAGGLGFTELVTLGRRLETAVEAGPEQTLAPLLETLLDAIATANRIIVALSEEIARPAASRLTA